MQIQDREIKLIIGLGNPGSRFLNTRHNIGTEFATLLSHELQKKEKPRKTNLNFSHLRIFGDISIVFPAVYMNESGKAITEAMDATKAKPNEILVIHDDLETLCGKWKFKKEGSASGHNGLKSTIEHLKTDDFMRLKIGVGRPESHDAEVISKYVLSKIPNNEMQKIEQALREAYETLSRDIDAKI